MFPSSETSQELMWQNLKRHYDDFTSDLDPKHITPQLFRRQVISADQMERIESKPARCDRATYLFRVLLSMQAKQPRAIQDLYAALLPVYDHLALMLCKPLSAPPGSLTPSHSNDVRTGRLVVLEALEQGQTEAVTVRVQVVATLEKRRDSVTLAVAQGDSAALLQLLLQGSMALLRFDNGASILVRNAVWTGCKLTAGVADVLSTGNVAVSEAGLQAAGRLLTAPETSQGGSTHLTTIASASLGAKLAVEVTVLKVEHRKYMVVNGRATSYREARVADQTGQLGLEMWGELASLPLWPGQSWLLKGEIVTFQDQQRLRLRCGCPLRAGEQVSGVMMSDSWLKEDGHQWGQLEAFSLVIYNACPKPGCKNRKLNNMGMCPGCKEHCPGSSCVECARADLGFSSHSHPEEMMYVTAFCPAISQLYSAHDLEFDPAKGVGPLTDILQRLLPLSCGFLVEKGIVRNIRCGKIPLYGACETIGNDGRGFC